MAHQRRLQQGQSSVMSMGHLIPLALDFLSARPSFQEEERRQILAERHRRVGQEEQAQRKAWSIPTGRPKVLRYLRQRSWQSMELPTACRRADSTPMGLRKVLGCLRQRSWHSMEMPTACRRADSTPMVLRKVAIAFQYQQECRSKEKPMERQMDQPMGQRREPMCSNLQPVDTPDRSHRLLDPPHTCHRHRTTRPCTSNAHRVDPMATPSLDHSCTRSYSCRCMRHTPCEKYRSRPAGECEVCMTTRESA